MNEPGHPPKPGPQPSSTADAPRAALIHRVCIQCNNMFRVPADKFDARQCPNCHKG